MAIPQDENQPHRDDRCLPHAGDRAAETGGDAVVEVDGGLVRGVREGNIIAWRGIPYAAPPVGPLRFRAPAPPEPWQGVRDGSVFGHIAPQPAKTLIGRIATSPLGDEDCLTINVHAPASAHEPRATRRQGPDDGQAPGRGQGPHAGLGQGTGLPVMVFIHGGGYYEGSSRDFSGEGEGFVRTGRVVFVSFNYRLGALGYLDFTPWSTPARPIEGNLGLRDQVAALQWVRNNIRAFGGDPDRITVFGESAGGNAVTTLLAVPSARDLFARAIAQSAPANAVYPATLAERWAGEFLAILGEGAANGRGRRDDSDRRGLPRLRELRDLPGLRGFPGLRDLSGRRGLRELGSLGGLRAAVEGPEPADQKAAAPGTSSQAVLQRLLNGTVTELLVAAHVLQARTPEAYPGAYCFAPVVDGSFLPEPPIEAIRTGRAAPVPLIIGTNEREGTIFRGRMDILPGSATRIDALFERAPAGTRKRMRDAYPGLPHWRPASDFGGDYGFWYPTTRVADFHSRFAPVHVYRFDLAPRLLRLVGLDATHGVEMFTLFDRTAEPLARTMTALGGREEYARAGRRMRSRWLRFAESGTTTASWPAYTERTRATLIIDDDDRIQLDPHRDRRIAWNGFLPDLGNPPSAPGPGEGEAGT